MCLLQVPQVQQNFAQQAGITDEFNTLRGDRSILTSSEFVGLLQNRNRPPEPSKKLGVATKATTTPVLNTKTPVQQTKLAQTKPTKKKQTALVTSPPFARKILLGS